MNPVPRDRLPRNVRHRLRTAAAREALRRAGPALDKTLLVLDYPPSAANVPRYTTALPALAGKVAESTARYREALSTIGGCTRDLERIAVRTDDATEPSWANGFLPGLDSAAIYAFLRGRDPKRYIEIGSGNSTKFAARARRDGELRTHFTSIDPMPRAEVDALCEEVIRRSLESVDLEVFADVAAGDLIFMDGSHRVFMNNDVVTFFLEVLPTLPAGVLVGIHDIYLPFDYPSDIAERYYSEQYMLAAYLLGNPTVGIVLPSHYAFTELRPDVDAIWRSSPRFADVEPHGVAFWLETR